MKKPIFLLAFQLILGGSILMSCDPAPEGEQRQQETRQDLEDQDGVPSTDNMDQNGNQQGQNGDQMQGQNGDQMQGQSDQMQSQNGDEQSIIDDAQELERSGIATDNFDEFQDQATMQIGNYEQRIDELRSQVDGQDEETLNELDQEIEELRNETEEISSENFQSFQSDFNQRMDDVEQRLNELGSGEEASPGMDQQDGLMNQGQGQDQNANPDAVEPNTPDSRF